MFASFIAGELSSILGLSIGQVVKATVTVVTDTSITCKIGDGVKGFVTLEHMPGKCDVILLPNLSND